MAQFTNQATLRYNGTITNSNVVTGEIREVISVTKTTLLGTYSRNGTITYLVSILNSGTADYTGLTVTDNLGQYIVSEGVNVVPLDYETGSVKYYINGELQTAPAVVSGPPLVVNGITVPAGGNTIIVYEARANEYAPLNAEGIINNTATVSGGGLNTPVEAVATVFALAKPILSITKSLCPSTVTENGEITYTFYIQNTGNTAITSVDDVTVSDDFAPAIDLTSVIFNGNAWVLTTDYTYDETTGEFATVPGRITVPAATYSQNPTTGVWTVTPGVSTLVITGTI